MQKYNNKLKSKRYNLAKMGRSREYDDKESLRRLSSTAFYTQTLQRVIAQQKYWY